MLIKFLKYTIISKDVNFRKQLPINRIVTKTGVLRFLRMCNCNIFQFSKRITIRELTKHKNQHMVPMKYRPPLSSVVVLVESATQIVSVEETVLSVQN